MCSVLWLNWVIPGCFTSGSVHASSDNHLGWPASLWDLLFFSCALLMYSHFLWKLKHKKCVDTHMKSKARSVLEHCLLITNSTCWGRVRETGQLCSNVLTERSSSLFNLQAGLLFPGSYLVAFAPMYTCSIPRVM